MTSNILAKQSPWVSLRSSCYKNKSLNATLGMHEYLIGQTRDSAIDLRQNLVVGVIIQPKTIYVTGQVRNCVNNEPKPTAQSSANHCMCSISRF